MLKVAMDISEKFKPSGSYLTALKVYSENAKTLNTSKVLANYSAQASLMGGYSKAYNSYAELLKAYTNSLPKSFDLYQNMSSNVMSDWIKKFEDVVEKAKINNATFSSLISPSMTIRDSIAASYNLDFEYNLGLEQNVIDDKILEKANEVLDEISNNTDNALSAINNFLIEFFTVDSVSFTRSFIRDIILNLFCAYLVQTMFPSPATTANSIINNNQVTNNNTNSNNQTVINNNTTINLTVNNLVVGSQYKTAGKKGLKHNRIKKIKSFDEIPEGTTITLIKKYRKYIVISYLEDGIFKYGYTEADGITNIE